MLKRDRDRRRALTRVCRFIFQYAREENIFYKEMCSKEMEVWKITTTVVQK